MPIPEQHLLNGGSSTWNQKKIQPTSRQFYVITYLPASVVRFLWEGGSLPLGVHVEFRDTSCSKLDFLESPDCWSEVLPTFRRHSLLNLRDAFQWMENNFFEFSSQVRSLLP